MFNPACAFCLFVIKKLESLLPPNVTEVTLVVNMSFITWNDVKVTLFFFFLSLQDALMKLMGEVCDLLPESYKNQCDDFIAKYGKEIVEFLLSSAAPHTICTLLHLCLLEEQTVPGQSHWTVGSCYWLDLTFTLLNLCWHRAVSSLGLRVLSHVGCTEPTQQWPQLHPTQNLLFPPVCVFSLSQRHPQGLTLNTL